MKNSNKACKKSIPRSRIDQVKIDHVPLTKCKKCNRTSDPFFEKAMLNFLDKMKKATWSKELHDDLKKMYNL